MFVSPAPRQFFLCAPDSFSKSFSNFHRALYEVFGSAKKTLLVDQPGLIRLAIARPPAPRRLSAAVTYVLRLTASNTVLSSADDIMMVVDPTNASLQRELGRDGIIFESNGDINGTTEQRNHLTTMPTSIGLDEFGPHSASRQSDTWFAIRMRPT